MLKTPNKTKTQQNDSQALQTQTKDANSIHEKKIRSTTYYNTEKKITEYPTKKKKNRKKKNRKEK